MTYAKDAVGKTDYGVGDIAVVVEMNLDDCERHIRLHLVHHPVFGCIYDAKGRAPGQMHRHVASILVLSWGLGDLAVVTSRACATWKLHATLDAWL